MQVKINTEAMERNREINGWTITETAKKIGITDPGYRKIVSGQTKTPNQETRRGIAAAFGVTVAQVIGFEPWE